MAEDTRFEEVELRELASDELEAIHGGAFVDDQPIERPR